MASAIVRSKPEIVRYRGSPGSFGQRAGALLADAGSAMARTFKNKMAKMKEARAEQNRMFVSGLAAAGGGAFGGVLTGVRGGMGLEIPGLDINVAWLLSSASILAGGTGMAGKHSQPVFFAGAGMLGYCFGRATHDFFAARPA